MFFRLIRVNSKAGSKKVSGPGDPKWPEMPEKSKTKICHPLTSTKFVTPLTSTKFVTPY